FEFPGATPEQAALLTTAARHAMGAEYGRSSLVAVAKFDLFPVFLQRGYLKATFGASEARVLPHPPPAEDAQVAVGDVQVIAIVPVTPGKVYSTSGVEWKGNSALTIAEVAPLVAVRLLRDVENIGKFYRSRGYMTIQVKPEAQFDDEHSAVHYDLNVVEG